MQGLKRSGLMVVALFLMSMLIIPTPALGQPDKTLRSENGSRQITARYDLGDYIDVEVMAEGQVDEAIVGSGKLQFQRIAVAPGLQQNTAPSGGPQLLVVEQGQLILIDELGLEGQYDEGDQVLLPSGAGFGMRNDGATAAVFLRLSFGSSDALPPATKSTTIVTGAASPVATDDSAEEKTLGTLFDAEIAEFPPAPLHMFILATTWYPDSDTNRISSAGPIGIVVESGTLSVSGASGIEAQLPTGKSVVFPAEMPHRLHNASEEPVTVLMAGIVPADQQLAQTILPTPTPEPTATSVPPTATPSPTAEPTMEPTSTPMPTPTPQPKAGTVLYSADTSGGLDQWELATGWRHLDGMLVSTGDEGEIIFAPFGLQEFTDYAFEAEIQLISTNAGSSCSRGALELIARAIDDGHYHAGLRGINTQYDCKSKEIAAISAHATKQDLQYLATTGYAWDYEWHTYRIEVQSNYVRLLIDGGLVLQAQDNRFLDGGLIGLSAPYTQVSVRSVKVIKLGKLKASATNSTSDDAATITDDNPSKIASTNQNDLSYRVGFTASLATIRKS